MSLDPEKGPPPFSGRNGSEKGAQPLFARAFGLQVVDFVEPKPGIPPSPNHLQDLVTEMKGTGVRLLVIEPFFDPRVPQKLARDTGVPLAVLPTSVGAEDGIRTYFDLFDRLFVEIGQALKGAKS